MRRFACLMRHPAEPWNSGTRPGGWAAVLGSGVFLGCVISLMELIEQPMAGTSLSAAWVFLSAKGGYWMVAGVVWAIFVQLAEPRFGAAALTLLGLVTALVMSVALLIPTEMSRLAWSGPRGSADAVIGVLPLDARLAHLLWTNCFYGGLYLAVFTGVRRAAELRSVLARMQQARDELAMRLKERQLQAFRRQLQPEAVTEALAALKALYRSNPEKADSLVDLLVGFLRPALRSLLADATTFAAELDLARRYLRLRSATTGEACEIIEDSRPAPEAPFPPRVLVPVLERLCLAGPGARMTMGWCDKDYHVEVVSERLAADAISETLREEMTRFRTEGAWRLDGRLTPMGAGVRWTLIVSPTAACAMSVLGD